MSSHGQVRVVGRPWGLAFIHSAIVLRADNVAAQGMRFACSGVVVSVVYIATTTVLSAVVHLRFQVALVIGWCAAVSVHFTLQRTFVWAREQSFALPFGRQVGRYLLVAVSQLGVTAATTTVLPPLLGVSSEVVYLATGALITVFNFLVFRNGVFHAVSHEASISSASGAPAAPPRSP
jgi:putative flippase GtrA